MAEYSSQSSEQIYITKESRWQPFGLALIHPSFLNITPNHAARRHDRSVPSLSTQTIYCSQTASDRKTTNKYYLLPYGTIKHSKCMQSHFFDIFLPLPTKYLHSWGTTIFNFLSHKNPLFFAVANAITFFLSKVWSIDIIKENKTHQKNTPYCSILTSNGNHIKDSWGC